MKKIIKDGFNNIKNNYSGFYVDLKVKEGNGHDVSGYLLTPELENELLAYIGLDMTEKNYLFVIKPDGKASYLSFDIINSVAIDFNRINSFSMY